MKTYKVEVQETVTHEMKIRAKTKRKARAKAEDIAAHGHCCAEDETQCYDSGFISAVLPK